MKKYEFETAIQEFKKRSVKHAHQSAALLRAQFLVSMCPSVNFVIVAGPTGAGKTHLLESLEQTVNASNQLQMQEEPSILPCISTIAVADGARQFGWARFWRDALIALRDPFALSRPERGVEDRPRLYPSESLTTSMLREQVEAELKLRKTKVWIIDEAQHMLLGGKMGEPGDQFDVLKSVAQLTEVKIVLCGTYQLPSLLSYSGQVMRRSSIVNLRRYDFSVKEEMRTLASVANALLQSLPIDSFPDPKLHCEDIFFGTLGCIGVLKDWIARAWALADSQDTLTLSMDHFNETRLPPKTLEEMNEEIVAGESQNTSFSEKEYRARVLSPKVVELENPKKPRISGRPRPGQRNPGRDPVGTANHRVA